jgi:hypothetical protein
MRSYRGHDFLMQGRIIPILLDREIELLHHSNGRKRGGTIGGQFTDLNLLRNIRCKKGQCLLGGHDMMEKGR